MKVYILITKMGEIHGVFMDQQEAELRAASMCPKHWHLFFNIQEWEVE